MLTGAVPVVPTGHPFHKRLVHGESGFICEEYSQWKATVRELYENDPYRQKISRQGAAVRARTVVPPGGTPEEMDRSAELLKGRKEAQKAQKGNSVGRGSRRAHPFGRESGLRGSVALPESRRVLRR